MSSTLVDIVVRASTIGERLAGGFIPAGDISRAEARLSRWRDVACGGDAERFEQRLQSQSLDPDRVRAVLGAVHPPRDFVLPSWVSTLRAYESAAAATVADLDVGALADRAIMRGQPVPFEEVLLPFVRVARSELAPRTKGISVVADTGIADLEHGLLSELSDLCAESLAIEFELAKALEPAPARGSRYQAFVRGMLTDRLAAFFLRYPVLARLACVRVECWVTATAELIERVDTDWPALEAAFHQGRSLEPVARIVGRLSDSHRGGRSVGILTTGNGVRIVYKPRPVAADVVLGDVVRELGLPLRIPRAIDRGEYGWHEFIETRRPATGDDAAYHRTSGIVLALAHLLGIGDLHQGNVIPSDDELVLIDLEVVPDPYRWIRNEPTTAASVRRAFWESAQRTGLVPYHDTKRGGREGGGLARPQPAAPRKTWLCINTDWMTFRENDADSDTPPANASWRRSVGERLGSYREDVDQLLAGYRDTYDIIRRQAGALLAPGAALDRLRAVSSRIVHRDTSYYCRLIDRSLQPSLLADMVDREIELEAVYRADPSAWPVSASEVAQMVRLDVPYFRARPNDTMVLDGDGCPLAEWAEQSGFETMVARLQALGADARDVHADVIRTSFNASMHRVSRSAFRHTAIVEEDEIAFVHRAALEHARAIADEVCATALDGDAGPRWYGTIAQGNTTTLTLGDVGNGFGHGRAGIALFLAAAARVFEDETYERVARAAVADLTGHDAEKTVSAMVEDDWGLGMSKGAGGVVYALARLAKLLRAPELLDAADRVVRAVTRERVVRDRALEMYAGTAGLCAGLLALYERRPAQDVLDAAIACGEHLIDARARDPITGCIAWRTTDDGSFTSGFAHGAAGIIHALRRLHHVTGRVEFENAARDGMAFAARLFDEAAGNWAETPDELQSAAGAAKAWCAWCHGAPGIGLAHLGSRGTIERLGVRHQLAAAFRTTLEHRIHTADHLCCGNLGRVAFLSAAAAARRDAPLAAEARHLVARVLRQARERGAFTFQTTSTFAPGMMQGVSGVGYELLRLTHPTTLTQPLLLA